MKGKNGFQYQAIYRQLKDLIESKTVPPGQLLPAENAIAQKYGVDRSTARKALQLLVDEGLVKKKPGKGSVVLEDSVTKKAVKATSFRNIGFLLPSGNAITQPFYSTLFYVLEYELKRYNYTLIYSTFDVEDDLLKTVSRYDLSGIIFVSNIAPEQIGVALEADIPCVLVNSYDLRIPSILSDNKTGAYQAARHLIECGHRNVIVLAGIRSYICSEERIAGFKQAFEEIGIKLNESDIIFADSWEQESGTEAIREYLKKSKKLPTAIFGLNDRLAYGVMQALYQCNLKVPDDISVIGYDNLNAKMSVIPLTSIEAHVDYVAEAAAQSLLWQLSGGKKHPFRLSIPTNLVLGETVNNINETNGSNPRAIEVF